MGSSAVSTSDELAARLNRLELQAEAFQSINLSIFAILYELNMPPAARTKLLAILKAWESELEKSAKGGMTLGLEMPVFYLAFFTSRLTGSAPPDRSSAS